MRRLFLSKLTSIGAVADGDNPEASIMLYKSRNTAEFLESRIHSSFTQIADDMFGEGQLTRDERIALSSGIGSALDAFRERVEEAAPNLYSDDPYMQKAAGDVAVAITKYLKTKNTESVEPTERDSMSKPDLTGLDTELRKAVEQHIADEIAAAAQESESESVLPDDLPAPVVKALAEKDETLAKERQAREALEADVAKMRDEQQTVKFAKRADDLAAVLGTGEEVPQALRELSEKAPEAYAVLDTKLEEAATMVKTSDALMFKQLGSSNDESDPVAKITAIAKTIHSEERDQYPTLEQARAAAWERNPDLFDEYQQTTRQVN